MLAQAPHKPDPWTGVRDAFEYGNGCVEKDSITGSFKGDEDCLTLNVYSPGNCKFSRKVFM